MPKIYFLHPHAPPESRWGDPSIFRMGMNSWILRAYLLFRDAGIPCELVREMPDEGIVITFRIYLPRHLRPDALRFFVCIEAEVGMHPFSKIDIVQSPGQAGRSWGKKRYYLPHPPQPAQIHRDPSRGDRFETIGYFGGEANLDPRLASPDFAGWAASHGLRFEKHLSTESWRDFRETDAVLAIRRLGAPLVINKPASKLYNAWHAGVIPILGPEDAFRHHGRPGVDYIEVTTLDEVKTAILRLKEDGEWRRALLRAGRERSPDFTHERLMEVWLHYLTDQVGADAEEWFGSPMARLRFRAQRELLAALRFIKRLVPGIARMRLAETLRSQPGVNATRTP